MTRPNIVVFIPDQLRADALGCFGNPVASTPNIDALAASGTRFADAWGQHPFCSPSRVSFLTGWYPHVHGHRTLTSLIKPWQPDALAVLKDSGYHVAHAGLRGDTWSTGGTKRATSRFGWLVSPDVVVDAIPYEPDHKLARAFYSGRRDGPTLDFDEATVRTAESWLGDGLPEPWLLYVPLIFPHPPFAADEPWFSMHDRADVPLPRSPAPNRVGPAFKALIHDRYGLGRLDDHDWREIVSTYYGMVSRMDDHLGRVLRAVDAVSSTDRTAVLFFPDHGEFLGDEGLIEKWISGMDPCLLRNPLIIRVPGAPEGNVATGLAELLDVAPTLYDLAGIDPGYRHFGRSLLPLVHDGVAPHRDVVFSEGGLLLDDARASEPKPFPYDLKHAVEKEHPVAAGKVTAIRTSDWTYVHRVHEADELYDRHADPDECHDLAGDAAHAPVLAQLRASMLEWLVETSDVLPLDADPRWDVDGAITSPPTSV